MKKYITTDGKTCREVNPYQNHRQYNYKDFEDNVKTFPLTKEMPIGETFYCVDAWEKGNDEVGWETIRALADALEDDGLEVRDARTPIEKPLEGDEKERILCAAIHYDDGNEYADSTTMFGVVISGFRHSDCYLALEVLAGKDAVNKVSREHQGFLTNKNRYVSRSEAWKIAVAANQILYGYETCKGENAILISENLY